MAGLLSLVGHLTLSTLCTIHMVLRKMHENLQHDQHLRLLPFRTLDRIRQLKLNNKPCKSRLHLRQQQHQYKANMANLIRIKNDGYKLDSGVTFATCNIQLLHYKELQVSQLISDYSLDFIVLTETWLNSNLKSWKDSTILNRDQLKLHTAD